MRNARSHGSQVVSVLWRPPSGQPGEMAVPTVVVVLLGVWADRQFATKPWLMFAGLMVGVVLAAGLITHQIKESSHMMFFAAVPHLSQGRRVFSIAGWPITNTNLVGLLGLIVLAWLMFRTRAAVLGKKKANFATRLLFGALRPPTIPLGRSSPPKKWTRRAASFAIITMFFFIAKQYWLGYYQLLGQ